MSAEEFKLIAEDDNPSGVGARLRGARLKSGRTLIEISNELKIRQEHLTAIEKEQFSELPGGAYTVGFIKSYAAAVGDDGDEVVRILKEYQKVTTDVTLPQFEKVETDVLPSSKTLFILLGLILVAALAWWVYSSGVVSALFDEKEIAVDADEIVTDSPEETDENVTGDASEQITSEDEKAVENILFEMGKKVEKVTEETLAPVVEKFGSHESLPVVLKAEDDVWLSVYKASDKANPVLNTVLKKGETYVVPEGDDLQANVGRPHVLSLSIGGKDYPVVGPEWGGVIKGLPLSSEYLVETFYGQNVNEESYSRWLKKQ